MRHAVLSAVFIGLILVVGCDTPPNEDHTSSEEATTYNSSLDSLRYTGEIHLRNIRQLTHGGNNAEAYFSFDNELLIFQSDWSEINSQGCDQQFIMRVDGQPFENGELYQQVSTGEGRTTCGYFLPDGRILYASTHAAGPDCPIPPPSDPTVYTWPVHSSYDIYVAEPDGSNPEVLISSDVYDAEPSVSPDGRFIVFTSARSGDLNIWRYEIETGELLQLTHDLGYDGGAFFSPDSERIIWRASRPTSEAAERHIELLNRGLVQPNDVNLMVMNADGSDQRRVIELPGANWAPFFHPDGNRVLFSSNHASGSGRFFDIFMIDLDTLEMTQITNSGTFDSFPMFSFDGKYLVWSSNRRIDRQPSGDTNVFIAEWVEHPTAADSTFQTLVQE